MDERSGSNMTSIVDATIAAAQTPAEPKWITLGHPSYVWRSGQDRRLNLIRQHVPLEQRRILDVGCGIGTYIRKFRQFSDTVYGVDVDPDKVAKASLSLPNISTAPAEMLPFPDNSFDVVLLHEVIEHVDDDACALAEAVRVADHAGRIIIYAPNRLYPFETHGAYFGSRYVFGLIPFVNYFPDGLRKYFCPHVRAYTRGALFRLIEGLPVRVIEHSCVYPGFDNIAVRSRVLAKLLRRFLYTLEHTSLQAFGLSHFIVIEKNGRTTANNMTSATASIGCCSD